MLSTINNFQTEITFSIESEAEMFQSFRKSDQKKLLLPAGLKFPLKVSSYFTWREPSNTYTYLIFKKPNWDLPRGVVFKRAHQAIEGATGQLCSWCHAYGSSEEIGMLSVAASANTSFTYILCRDLRCIEKIDEAATLSGKNSENWIHQLYHRIGLFFEQISNYKPE
jgi:FBP C-terminal treble-clef zinc-finger